MAPSKVLKDARSKFLIVLPCDIRGHFESCDYHEQLQCHGITQIGMQCAHIAKNFDGGLMPTCKLHMNKFARQAGRCQAIEACGQPCYRYADLNPPFNFCSKHSKGDSTLPCYIMNLPPEIRGMILQYHLPASIPTHCRYPTWKAAGLNFSHMALNKQIYDEWTFLFYQKVSFNAHISQNNISILGKTWHYREEDSQAAPVTIMPIKSIQKIRNLQVTIDYTDRGVPSNIDPYSQAPGAKVIDKNDYLLYLLRDMVFTFVFMIQQPASAYNDSRKSLLGLAIKVEGVCKDGWYIEETLAAVAFLVEPFKYLYNVKNPTLLPVYTNGADGRRVQIGGRYMATDDRAYRHYQAAWRGFLQHNIADLYHDLPFAPRDQQAHSYFNKMQLYSQQDHQVHDLFNKIRKFLKEIHEDSITDSSSTTTSAVQTVINGRARLLHRARMAREQHCIGDLVKIRDAIWDRWSKYNQQLLDSRRKVTEGALDMFTGEAFAPADPDILTLTHYAGDVRPETTFSDTWPELEVHDGIPDRHLLNDKDMESWEDDGRIYYMKDNALLVYPKVPALVRYIRMRKAQNRN